MRTTLLSVLLLFISLVAQANVDITVTQHFGNVKIQMTTSPDLEETQKVWTVGRLAEKLCKQLNYSEPVFISLHHAFLHSEYHFISFDTGVVGHAYLKKTTLIVRAVTTQFDATTILKMLEFAIVNSDKIRTTQQDICFDSYQPWLPLLYTNTYDFNEQMPTTFLACIKTFDTSNIRNLILQKESALVQKILCERIYRHTNMKTPKGVSYYEQNNKYHIFDQSNNAKDSVLLTTERIYRFKKIFPGKAVLVGPNDSVYFIRSSGYPYYSSFYIKNITRSWSTIRRYGRHKVRVSFYDDDQQRHEDLTYDYNTRELVAI